MKRRLKRSAIIALVVLLVAAVAAIAAGRGAAEADPVTAYSDGTYYVEGEPDARGRQALIEITVLNGAIIAVHYDEVERNEAGEVTMSKRDNYGYAGGWRAARDDDVTQLSAFPAYENQLLLTGDLGKVDLVSGATGSYESFKEVAAEALERARR